MLWARYRLKRMGWIDTTAIEVFVSLQTFFLGVQFARPDDLFRWLTFKTMSYVAPEETWAAVFMAIGLWQLGAILAWHQAQRRFVLLLMGLLWYFVAGLVWLSYHGSTLLTFSSVIAFATTWAYVRLGRSR